MGAGVSANQKAFIDPLFALSRSGRLKATFNLRPLNASRGVVWVYSVIWTLNVWHLIIPAYIILISAWLFIPGKYWNAFSCFFQQFSHPYITVSPTRDKVKDEERGRSCNKLYRQIPEVPIGGRVSCLLRGTLTKSNWCFKVWLNKNKN